ncbi:MAG: 1-acyl-sn-glycerol-3-phosphate acyltransferase [Clostridia bacterium]|nr:1-acyl-sn-glycerol-3-phosphate acyltransferase [Clostridia bacterium]
MDLRGLLDFVLCKTFFRVKFEGRENVDFSKRYVFVANHVSAIDAMLIYTDIQDLGIMAKAELFKNKLFAKVLSSQGVFPIERGKKDFGHVYHAVKIITKHDKNLLIFPEGTRKAKNKGVKAKHGAVYIAATADVQIVPMHITEKIKLFRKIRIVYGKPIDLKVDKENIKDKKLLAEETERIMDIVYSMGDENGR